MTALRRLADKGLVVQHRADRAHRCAAVRGRDELVAELMLDALDQVGDSRDRRAALVHFVESVRTCIRFSARSTNWGSSTSGRKRDCRCDRRARAGPGPDVQPSTDEFGAF